MLRVLRIKNVKTHKFFDKDNRFFSFSHETEGDLQNDLGLKFEACISTRKSIDNQVP